MSCQTTLSRPHVHHSCAITMAQWVSLSGFVGSRSNRNLPSSSGVSLGATASNRDVALDCLLLDCLQPLNCSR